MTDINNVNIIGRLVRDPEYRELSNNNTVANFSIACNKSRRDGDDWIEEGHFFDVALFGRQADAIRNFLKQGKQVAVNGSLHQNKWETDDGQKRSKVVIRAFTVQLLGGKNDAPSDESSASQSQADVASEVFSDDIPF